MGGASPASQVSGAGAGADTVVTLGRANDGLEAGNFDESPRAAFLSSSNRSSPHGNVSKSVVGADTAMVVERMLAKVNALNALKYLLWRGYRSQHSGL